MVIASNKSTIASSILPPNKTSAKTIEFPFYDRKGKKIIKKWLPKFSSVLTIYWSAVLVTIFPIQSTVCLISIFHCFQVSVELYFPPCTHFICLVSLPGSLVSMVLISGAYRCTQRQWVVERWENPFFCFGQHMQLFVYTGLFPVTPPSCQTIQYGSLINVTSL